MIDSAQSEEQFELEVIDRLAIYGWTPRPDLYYKTESALLDNWRAILNEQNQGRLRAIALTDGEFAQLAEQIFAIKTPLQAGQLLAKGQLQLVRDADGVESESCFWISFGDMMLAVAAIAMRLSARLSAQPSNKSVNPSVLTSPCLSLACQSFI